MHSMAYYLKHHFDPDFDYTRLAPQKMDDGSVDHYELNYVQNVTTGQLLAEFEVLDDELRKNINSRFVFEEKKFPAGRGTGFRESEPNRLYAARDGFVLYEEGLICVRKTLNVRHDVDFSTGNIDFVSDLNVFGTVGTGFSLSARTIDVGGHIQGAHVKARENLSCRSGVKGEGQALLEAGGDIRLAFCEYATLTAKGNVLIKNSLLHSRVFAGKRLAVGDRLIGCDVCAHNYVYVGEQLGGGMGADLTITLGYDPQLLFKSALIDQRISELWEQLHYAEAQVAKGGFPAKEYEPRLITTRKDLQETRERKAKLWQTISRTERLGECKILVPGVVKPGVEISIGNAYLKVDDYYEDVVFFYEDREVRVAPSQTMK
mgnify:CR=1 FL=1